MKIRPELLIDDFAKKKTLEHPDAWQEFCLYMDECQYSNGALTDAWFWFIYGWVAKESKK